MQASTYSATATPQLAALAPFDEALKLGGRMVESKSSMALKAQIATCLALMTIGIAWFLWAVRLPANLDPDDLGLSRLGLLLLVVLLPRLQSLGRAKILLSLGIVGGLFVVSILLSAKMKALLSEALRIPTGDHTTTLAALAAVYLIFNMFWTILLVGSYEKSEAPGPARNGHRVYRLLVVGTISLSLMFLWWVLFHMPEGISRGSVEWFHRLIQSLVLVSYLFLVGSLSLGRLHGRTVSDRTNGGIGLSS